MKCLYLSMFCNGRTVLIVQQWRSWWLYSRIKANKDLVCGRCRSSTILNYFEISTTTASRFVVTHYTTDVASSFGYISRGNRIRYESPTVKVFYDKFIDLGEDSSYDRLRYVFINLFILGYLLRYFGCIILKCQMVGLCVNWSWCGVRQL